MITLKDISRGERRTSALWMVCAFLLAGSRMLAQVSTASVTGTVVDVTSARIPGADVKLVNMLTGAESDSKTSRSGTFFVPGVIPGEYMLEIDRDGFAPVQVADLILHVSDTKNFLVRMQVGSVAQTVNVDEATTLLDTGDISISTVVDKGFVSNMPLNGRSFQDLIAMTPGVIAQSPQTPGESFGARGTFSVNGQGINTNAYFVDGVSANVGAGLLTGHQKIATDGSIAALTALGTTQSLVSVDALQEFRVLSSTYSTEYGRLPGGQFSLLTRSGTNQVHGSLFNYVRTDAIDAVDWYTRFNHADSRTAYHQDDFGGTLGAPVPIPEIHPGKDETFVFLSYEGLNVQQPAAPQVQFIPDLELQRAPGLALRPILNLFPTGVYAQNFPSAEDTGLAPYPGGATSYPGTINATSIRFDHSVSSKLSGFFRYSETPSSSEAGTLSSLTRVHGDTRTFTGGVATQLSSRMSNDFRVGQAMSKASLATTLDNFFYSSAFHYGTALNALVGIPPSPDSASADVFIQIPGAGPSEIQTDQATGSLHQWNIRDTISAQIGSHLLRLGIDQRHVASEIHPPEVSVEADFFSKQALLQNSASAISITRNTPATPLFQQFGAFVQDEWKLSKSFSLSSGLRWEVAPSPHGRDGQDAYTLDGDMAVPSTLRLAPRGTPLWRTSKAAIAPRVGGVWSPGGSAGHGLLLRAGVGVFLGTANQPAAAAFSALGFSTTNHLTNAPLPVTPTQIAASTDVSEPYRAAVFAFPQHLQLPYALQWNIGIEKALGSRQSLSLSWIGTNGRRLLQTQQINISNENPLFQNVYYLPGHITSSYQALQFKFQRTLSRGVQILANYGWSHTIDYGTTAPIFPLSRGNSDLDVRHNLQVAVSWDTRLQPATRFAKAVIGGWGVDGRLTVRSAFPITPLGNIDSDPNTGNRYYSGVDLIPGRPLQVFSSQYPGGRAINGGWSLTAAAFTLPQNGQSGNAPRNLVRGFGAYQMNLAVRRELHLFPKAGVQVRLDIFNVFNHPQFGYVDPVLTDALFGQATLMLNQSFGSTGSLYEPGGPRSMQLSVRVHY